MARSKLNKIALIIISIIVLVLFLTKGFDISAPNVESLQPEGAQEPDVSFFTAWQALIVLISLTAIAAIIWSAKVAVNPNDSRKPKLARKRKRRSKGN